MHADDHDINAESFLYFGCLVFSMIAGTCHDSFLLSP